MHYSDEVSDEQSIVHESYAENGPRNEEFIKCCRTQFIRSDRTTGPLALATGQVIRDTIAITR
jgi:hypothetical protein